jgi:hypothetical protein
VHSRLEAGQIPDIFDGDSVTLIRGLEANPLVLDFHFSQPRTMSGLTAIFGAMDDFTVTISLYAPGSDNPVAYSQNYRGLPPDPKVEWTFNNDPQPVIRAEIDIHNNRSGNTAQIHVRELQFR